MGGMESEMGQTAEMPPPEPPEPPEAEQWTAEDMQGDMGDFYGDEVSDGDAADIYGTGTAEDVYGDTEHGDVYGDATADDLYGDTDDLGETDTKDVFGDQPVQQDQAADPDTLNRDRWRDGIETGPPSAETMSVQLKNERQG